MTVDPQRLAIVQDSKLRMGNHGRFGKMCLLEAEAYVHGGQWTDQPDSVCPVLARFLRALNDRLSSGQRQELKRYVGRLSGTAGSEEDRRARRALLSDWHVRTGHRLSRGRGQHAIDEATGLALYGGRRDFTPFAHLSKRARSAVHALVEDLIAVGQASRLSAPEPPPVLLDSPPLVLPAAPSAAPDRAVGQDDVEAGQDSSQGRPLPVPRQRTARPRRPVRRTPVRPVRRTERAS